MVIALIIAAFVLFVAVMVKADVGGMSVRDSTKSVAGFVVFAGLAVAVAIAVSPAFDRIHLGSIDAPLVAVIIMTLMPGVTAPEKRYAWLALVVAAINVFIAWSIDRGHLQQHREDIFAGTWLLLIALRIVYIYLARRRSAQGDASTRSSIETL